MRRILILIIEMFYYYIYLKIRLPTSKVFQYSTSRI